MAELRDIVTYILRKYPNKDDLSKARLTKIIYLIDWKNSIQNGKLLTDLNWFYDNYGPFVWDVFDIAKKNPDLFEIKDTINYYGAKKSVISLKDDKTPDRLSSQEKEIIDFVIETTEKMSYNNFIKLVYSTYPIQFSEQYTDLNLPQLAIKYQSTKKS